jgi:hypothetical protein
MLPVEAVDADDEGDAPPLEEVDRGETGLGSADVEEDHGPQRADGEVVPHEPEPLLSGRTEEIQHQVPADGDPAEVQRHGGGRLPGEALKVVDAQARGGQPFLGAQRDDLADRSDHGGLPDPEAAGDQDLDRVGCRGPLDLSP